MLDSDIDMIDQSIQSPKGLWSHGMGILVSWLFPFTQLNIFWQIRLGNGEAMICLWALHVNNNFMYTELLTIF